MSEWLMLAAGLVLTIGTGFFVASEFALVNLDRADLEARRDRGETRLAMTIVALKITSTHLSSAQLGITLTTLLTGYLMEPSISSLLAGPLSSVGIPSGAVPAIGTIIGILIATLVSMILGELVPKGFALALPRATAKVVIPFQAAFTTVFRPAVFVLNASANGVLRLFGVEPKEELSGARSAEELASLVRRSASAGLLESDTATLLGRTLRFSEHTASDVMTPRPRVASVQRSDPATEVLALARRTGFSRFPVIDGRLDDIVGIVHVKQAVSVPIERRALVPASALQTDAVRVPETMTLDTLLGELRGKGYQMAVVVDEYGGTAGVATLEDLVEELVGDVADEHDHARADIVRGAGSITISGMLRPDELEDRTGIEIPEEGPYETVAGFVMNELDRLPVVGDEVRVDSGTLRVERLEGRRVDQLRFTPDPGTDPARYTERRNAAVRAEEPGENAIRESRAGRGAEHPTDRTAEQPADRAPEHGREADRA
ncbi:hemolysin family protein [Humibacter antri]